MTMLKAKFKASFASADLQRHSAIQIQKAIADVIASIGADCLIVSETQGAYTTIAGNAQYVMPASVYRAAQVVEVIGVTGDGYAVHVLPDGTLAI
jgi:hypothetical protein